MTNRRRLAVLTSGGDAPGMNAAIRAVVRAGRETGWETCGIRYGFRGLCADDFMALDRRSVGGTLQLGGTMLGSSRYPEFLDQHTRLRALGALERADIDALVVIGGNGTQQGAHLLAESGATVVGVASTIDNDLVGSDMSIGADTALDVALESIDRLRTTAQSHRRVCLVEVMGRDCGYLALHAAMAGGAEAVVLPEVPVAAESVAARILAAHAAKGHAIVVVAEGAHLNAATLAAFLEAHEPFDLGVRVTVLGHVQRGASPSAFDRLLASRLGAEAVAALNEGDAGTLVGWRAGVPARTPLGEVAGRTRALDLAVHELAAVLAR